MLINAPRNTILGETEVTTRRSLPIIVTSANSAELELKPIFDDVSVALSVTLFCPIEARCVLGRW